MSIKEFKEASVYWRNINALLKAKVVLPKRPINFESELTDKEVSDAFHKWRCARYSHLKADQSALAVLDIKRSCFAKSARKALFLSATAVAHRMGISKSQYSRFESAEAQGRCTINQLRKAAEAMDCELVYFVRPKKNELFSERIWQSLISEAQWRLKFRKFAPTNRSGALAAMAEELMRSPNFRREQGWSRVDK